MNCCSSIYNAGCFESCISINLEIPAPETGDYKIKWFQLGGEHLILQSFNAGDSINIVNEFNEDAEVLIQITDPSGNLVLGPGGEECIRFKVTPIYSVLDNR